MPTFWQKLPEIMGPTTPDTFWIFTQMETLRRVMRFIAERPTMSVLDVGCSTGILGCKLFELGGNGRYVGVDSNEKAIEVAKKNLAGKNAELYAYDAEKMNFPDQSFDVVFMKDLIEHAAYYEDILRESARVCNKHLIIAMFRKPTDAPDSIEPHPQGYHLNHYNKTKLFGFIDKLGFKHLSTIYEDNRDIVFVFERN
jgi:ubiquinone/menaquinone biosynthesis C-methylase UbiE